jgi:hypothetical protein
MFSNLHLLVLSRNVLRNGKLYILVLVHCLSRIFHVNILKRTLANITVFNFFVRYKFLFHTDLRYYLQYDFWLELCRVFWLYLKLPVNLIDSFCLYRHQSLNCEPACPESRVDEEQTVQPDFVCFYLRQLIMRDRANYVKCVGSYGLGGQRLKLLFYVCLIISTPKVADAKWIEMRLPIWMSGVRYILGKFFYATLLWF